MLKFFAPKLPSKTPRASLNDILLDNGRSRIIFNNAISNDCSKPPLTSPYLVTNHLPPAPSPPEDTESPNSSLCPPFHIHLKEDETFHVLSGEARFFFLNKRVNCAPKDRPDTKNGTIRQVVRAGGTFTIPQGMIHTFRNVSSTQDLVIEFCFSQTGSDTYPDSLNHKMKHFFLNTQLYRSDCTTQNIPRSLIQVLLFNYHADVALVPNWLLDVHKRYPLLRGILEAFLAPAVGRTMNFVGGVVIGKWLCGLKETYEKYQTTEQTIKTRGNVTSSRDVSNSLDSTVQVPKVDSAAVETKDDAVTKERKSCAKDAPPWACQAWRDHSFDGQDDSWRR